MTPQGIFDALVRAVYFFFVDHWEAIPGFAVLIGSFWTWWRSRKRVEIYQTFGTAYYIRRQVEASWPTEKKLHYYERGLIGTMWAWSAVIDYVVVNGGAQPAIITDTKYLQPGKDEALIGYVPKYSWITEYDVDSRKHGYPGQGARDMPGGDFVRLAEHESIRRRVWMHRGAGDLEGVSAVPDPPLACDVAIKLADGRRFRKTLSLSQRECTSSAEFKYMSEQAQKLPNASTSGEAAT